MIKTLLDAKGDPVTITGMMKIYPLRFLLTAVFTGMSVFVGLSVWAMADEGSARPFDFFIDESEHYEFVPGTDLHIDDPLFLQDEFSAPDEDEEDQRLRDEREAEARALEEAKRTARHNSLPALSQDKAERLDQLFQILKSTDNPILAERAQREIEGAWQDSGSDTIDLLLGWANAAMERRQFGKALDYLDNIIRLKPDFAEGWNRRATLYFLQKNFNRSIADVERTLELEPRHFSALAGLAMMLREMGHDEDALFAFKEALAINPSMTQIDDVIEELEEKLKGRDI